MKHPIVVVCQKEQTLGDLLPRLGVEAERALSEGRVFIGRRRATRGSEPVVVGEEIIMYPPRTEGDEAPTDRVKILAERDGLVAAYKPALMATVADHRGRIGTLQHDVAAMLGIDEAVLSPSSRLDVGVSGVVVFAADDSARAKLAEARERGLYRRHYVAIASAMPLPERGTWSAPIGRASEARLRRAFGRDAVPAETAYSVRAKAPSAALLAVEPRTGRTHQIRVHAAHAGCPLLGDAAYGGSTRAVSSTGSVTAIRRVALHAAWVEAPIGRAAPFRVDADLPDDLAAIWEAAGGPGSAWSEAWRPL